MPSTEDKPTVFYARDKNPPIDGLDGPVPSIEDKDESLDIVVSDIAGVENDEEEAPTPINPRSFARSVKRIRSAVSSEDESSSNTMETPPKRQRQRQRLVHPDAPATPRRSERISSAAASSGPKEEEPLAVKAPAKRGRGRPPGKKKAKANGPGPRPQQEWEIERIVDSQIDADTLEQFYLVKWKGFGSKENTWEPKKNLGKCRPLIVAFEKTMKKRR